MQTIRIEHPTNDEIGRTTVTISDTESTREIDAIGVVLGIMHADGTIGIYRLALGQVAKEVLSVLTVYIVDRAIKENPEEFLEAAMPGVLATLAPSVN